MDIFLGLLQAWWPAFFEEVVRQICLSLNLISVVVVLPKRLEVGGGGGGLGKQ